METPEFMERIIKLFKVYGFRYNAKRSLIDHFIARAVPEQKDKMLYDLYMLCMDALEQEELWKIYASEHKDLGPRPNY